MSMHEDTSVISNESNSIIRFLYKIIEIGGRCIFAKR